MTSYRPSLCHLGGRVVPLAEARIDPRDRGFLFGDAVYEGFRVLRGTILHLEEHLARLASGLGRLEIPVPGDIARRCLELVAACRLDTGFLYLQVTRGAGPRTRMPSLDLEPTVFLEATERAYEPGGEGSRKAIGVADPRWLHCDIKTTSLAATVTGKLRAAAAVVDEVLFLGDDGEIREGGSTNVFVRRGDALETHPLDGRVLPGVTRRLVLHLARDLADRLDLRVVERAPRLSERGEWNEAFLTGTITGLQPLLELDGEPVGDGAAGAWTRALGAALDDLESRRAAAGGGKVSA